LAADLMSTVTMASHGRRVHFLRVVCVRSEVVDEVLDLCKEAEKSTTAFLCPPLQVEQCSGFSNQVQRHLHVKTPRVWCLLMHVNCLCL
jgi:hypothetical protein